MSITDNIIGSIPFADKFTQTTGKISVPADGRIDRTDTCKLIWYQWAVEQKEPTLPNLFNKINAEAIIPDVALTQTRTYDISNHLSSFTFSKNINTPSGNFEFYLENSIEWDKYLKPGQWIVAALADNDPTLTTPQESQRQTPPGVEKVTGLAKDALSSLISGASAPFLGEMELTDSPPDIPEFASFPGSLTLFRDKIRTMGVISRVGIVSQTTPEGTEVIRYKVTGKDFGVCLEESYLWLDMASQEHSALKTFVDNLLAAGARTLDDLIQVWYKIFMAPELLVPSSAIPTTNPSKSPKQVNRGWLMPLTLLSDLGIATTINPTDPTSIHFGNIESVLEEVQPSLFGTGLGTEALQQDNGSVWNKLKSLSQPEFHELFTEIGEDGSPKIFFRPIPWARNKALYPIVGSVIHSWREMVTGSFDDLTQILTSPLNFLKGIVAKLTAGLGGKRIVHRVDVHPLEILMYDIGPTYEERYNQFIVDTAVKSTNTETAIAILNNKFKLQYPFRNMHSIKRNGLKPLHLYNLRFYKGEAFSTAYQNIKKEGNDVYAALNKGIQGLYGVGGTADIAFLYEANALMYDYHAKTSELYSGTIVIAGKNQIKLGKALVIDPSAKKIGNHAFYIEGYTDTFNVNDDGTASWEQTIQVTRGEHVSKAGGTLSITDKISNLVDDVGENLEQGATFHVDSGKS